jgi:hypothetical protein
MVRQFVLELGMAAAVCLPAASANAGYAGYMNLTVPSNPALHARATRRGSPLRPCFIAST